MSLAALAVTKRRRVAAARGTFLLDIGGGPPSFGVFGWTPEHLPDGRSQAGTATKTHKVRPTSRASRPTAQATALPMSLSDNAGDSSDLFASGLRLLPGPGGISLPGARAGDTEQICDLGPGVLLPARIGHGAGKPAVCLGYQAREQVQVDAGIAVHPMARVLPRAATASSKAFSVSSPVLGP